MADKLIIDREVITNNAAAAPRCAVSWGAIICGAITAVTITVIMLTLGSGLGLASVSPWDNTGLGLASFTIAAAIWMVITQWMASGVGGYVAGRLRSRSINRIHGDEIFFRDTAHGLITWSLATLVMVCFLSSAVTNIASGGAKAATAVTAAAAAGAGSEAAKNMDTNYTGYYVDSLFRSNVKVTSTEETKAETARILVKAAAGDSVTESDRNRLKQLVMIETGMSEPEAAARTNEVLADIDAVKTTAKQVADNAREAASMLAIFTAISMFVGAFIAIAAAAYGGIQREEYHDYKLK